MMNRRFLCALVTGLSLLCTHIVSAKNASDLVYEINYKDVSIDQFIRAAEVTLNKKFIIHPSVTGSLSVQIKDIRGNDEYFKLFETVLDLHGYSLIPHAQLANTFIVNQGKNAKKGAVPVYDSAFDVHHGMITTVVVLRHIAANRVAPVIRTTLDTVGNSLALNADDNRIILRGPASTVQVAEELIRKIDESGDISSDVDIVRLKHASATEAVELVNKWLRTIEGTKSRTKNAGSQVIADQRLNAIWVFGPFKDKVLELIDKLDQEAKTQGNTQVFYLKHAKAEKLVPILQGLGDSVKAQSSGANSSSTGSSRSSRPSRPSVGRSADKDGQFSVQFHEASNALIITASQAIMNQIKHVIDKLDIRRPQVLVEAIIVEVKNNKGDQLGVQWFSENVGGAQFTEDGTLSIGTVVAGVAGLNDKSVTPADVAANVTGVNGLLTGFYTGSWGSLIQALTTDGDTEILSTPSVVTMDNKEASILVGQTVGVPTGQRSSSSGNSDLFNEVKREEVGTKLKITPQINEGEVVQLEIEQEVSNVAASDGTYGPTFDKRNIKNTVLVKSGEAVVLGGLVSDAVTESVKRVPVLGHLPVLGDLLFSSKKVTKESRKLMVFIRPSILKTDQWYSALSNDRYQQMQLSVDAAKQPGGLLFRKYDKIKLPPLNPKPLSEINKEKEQPNANTLPVVDADLEKSLADTSSANANVAVLPESANIKKESVQIAETVPLESANIKKELPVIEDKSIISQAQAVEGVEVR